MKTSKKISNMNRYNRIILMLSVIPITIFILSILFHITPLGLLDIVSEFAVHHYFLSGFLAVIAFSICMRAFLYNNDKITQLQNDKRIASQLKINRRKARIQKFKNNIALKLFALRNRLQKKEIKNSNKYHEKDVLASQEEVQIRQYDLMYAMKLGNSFKQSVKLYYKESNLNKRIESAILFVSNEHVTLKGGYVLPIKSIYKVEI
ncbi:MAG: hypothetical protein JNM51_06175 [Bacteroidia bacterium]|nr:hypothetical protein [Bacteroidia bacterium]